VGARQRLAAWVRLLALTAADPSRPWSAVTVGRALDGDGVRVARIRPLGPDAEAHLATLIDLFDRGMREPPPLYCRTSAVYVAAGAAAARAEWESGHLTKEDAEPEHTLLFGGRLPFEALTLPAPLPSEHGAGWEESETTRFGRWARRLWAGLLACEELSDA
jgi:exodeoxyribonuclease V gamma subunit